MGFIATKLWHDQPTINKLLDIYDIVQPMFPEVRIIPQLHKEIGAR
jgi:hypothetical protein